MGLTLILGPANSAKAGEVLGAYAAAARRGALLVVPTATDARHYARELAGEGAVLGSVVTFSGLAGEIARRVDYPGRRLSDLQRARVLERVVGRSRFDALAASATAAGFAAAAGELIAELQRALIEPAQFSAALRRWAAEDVRRAPYARDLGRLYAEYVRELDRLGRVDRELFAWRTLDALRAEPWRWTRPGSGHGASLDAVYFYGFDDLTRLERDAVETLARIPGVDVVVSLTYEAGREALTARAETVEELRPLAERVRELPAQDQYYAPGSAAVLHHLERSLFTDEPQRVDPGDAVVLLEAGGERAEAELIAERVSALLRGGVPPGEIVIVHRSPRTVAALFARVFAHYGIPLETGQPVPLGHTALGRGLLAGARCAWLDDEEPATADDLLTYLRTPGLLQVPEVADALEADVRRAGLRTAAQARERLGWELPELTALAAARDPARELCRLAQRLFAAPHRGAAPTLSAAEELDARAVRALVAAVDELAELRLTPPPAELLALLEGIAVEPGGTGGGLGGAEPVRLAEPLEIRARRFRAVFVCGLQEGEFPLTSRPEPFLSDERRREVARASGLALRPREDSLAAERYLFYAAVSRATERVYLAYRSSDEEGNLALPSPFIADVAELLGPDWSHGRRRRLLADVVWPAELAPTARERERSLAAERAAPAGEAATPQRALGAGALASVRHSQILSPGALEAYGDCPVRWLIERELQPEPLAPESDAITRGNVMHDVLERLLRELDGPLTPASVATARDILERLLGELADGAGSALVPGGSDIVRAGALRAIEADLRRYLEYEAETGGGWRPLGLEMRFGFTGEAEDSLPPLELGDGDARVLVRGLIDRVDVDGRGHALVRDYKSGTRRPEWSAARWSGDRRLQVALYMLVVRELLGLEPVGGFYQPLRGDDLRARGVFVRGEELCAGAVGTDGRDPGEVDAILADAAERAVTLTAALRRGDLTPCPQTCSRDGCAYPAICRSQ